MPFLRLRLPIALTLLAAVSAAGVLYVIPVTAVHAAARPPSDLARLELQHEPAAAPEVAFTGAGGKRDSLAAFRGRYVLLNLWATWCAPCVRELPSLARLKAALPGMTVLAVNVGRDGESQTTAFLKAHGADALPVYVDSGAGLIGAFGIEGLPFSALIDPKGRVIARAVGPCEWGSPAAITYLRELTTPAARAPS